MVASSGASGAAGAGQGGRGGHRSAADGPAAGRAGDSDWRTGVQDDSGWSAVPEFG